MLPGRLVRARPKAKVSCNLPLCSPLNQSRGPLPGQRNPRQGAHREQHHLVGRGNRHNSRNTRLPRVEVSRSNPSHAATLDGCEDDAASSWHGGHAGMSRGAIGRPDLFNSNCSTLNRWELPRPPPRGLQRSTRRRKKWRRLRRSLADGFQYHCLILWIVRLSPPTRPNGVPADNAVRRIGCQGLGAGSLKMRYPMPHDLESHRPRDRPPQCR
jgi:hypothetical protein